MPKFAFAASGGDEIVVRLVQLDTASGTVDEGSTAGHVSDTSTLDERRVRPAGGAWTVQELTFCDLKADDSTGSPIAYQVVRKVASGTDTAVLVRVVEADGPGPFDPFALPPFISPRLSPLTGGGGGGGSETHEQLIETIGAPTAPPSVPEKVWHAIDPATGDEWAWMPSLGTAGQWIDLSEVTFDFGSPHANGAAATVDDPAVRFGYDVANEQAFWQVTFDLGSGLQWGAAVPLRGVEVGHGAPTSSADNPAGFFIDLDTGDVWVAWGSPSSWVNLRDRMWSLSGNAANPGALLGTVNAEDLRIVAGGNQRIHVDAATNNTVIGSQTLVTPGPHRQIWVGESHPDFGSDGFVVLAGDVIDPTNGAPAHLLGQTTPTKAGLAAGAGANDGTTKSVLNLSAAPDNSTARVAAQTASKLAEMRSESGPAMSQSLTRGRTSSLEVTASSTADDGLGVANFSANASDIATGMGTASIAAGINPAAQTSQTSIGSSVTIGTEARSATHHGQIDTTQVTADLAVNLIDSGPSGKGRSTAVTPRYLDGSDTVGTQIAAATQTESAAMTITPRGIHHEALDKSGASTPPAGGRQPVFVPADDPGGPGVTAGKYVRTAILQISVNVGANTLDLVATDHSGANPSIVCSIPVALNAATGNYELVP